MSIHISCAIMAKNERKRIETTLTSVKNIAKSIVLYDTGSEDNTIDIEKIFCEKYGIIFRLKKGTFTNFYISRNELLDFCDTFLDVDYLLLLDVNDELRGDKELLDYAVSYKNQNTTGFLLCQEWLSDINKQDTYYNVRFIKPRTGWRYKGAVHEYIINEINTHNVVQKLDNIVLYQNRMLDDDKTYHRFTRDRELLLDEYRANPNNSRTVFYLAQTYGCLKEFENALYYYKLRINMKGFWEEKFHSYLRSGEITEILGHPWTVSLGFYISAFECIARVEPLIYIAKYYEKSSHWLLAYTFMHLSSKLKYPEQCILFVNKRGYDYTRWYMLAKYTYHLNLVDECIGYCKKVLESECGTDKEKQEILSIMRNVKK